RQESGLSRFILRTGILIVCLSLVWASPALLAQTADSTDVREPETPKMSTGEALLKLPSMLLDIPILIVKGVAYSVIAVAYQGDLAFRTMNYLSDPKSKIVPVIVYGSNPGFGGGLSIRRNEFMGNGRLRLKGSYSSNRYSLVNLKFSNYGLANGRAGLTLQGEYQNQPRESFYGIGNDSREEDEMIFAKEFSGIHGDLAWQPMKSISVGILGGLTRVNLYDGDEPDELTDLDSLEARLVGFEATADWSRYYTIGGRLAIDMRDNKGQPSSGGLYQFELTYNKGTGDFKDVKFVVSRAEVSQYLNIWRKRILAVRLMAQNTDRSEDALVNPFYTLSSLGGPTTLRSYRENRFMERDMALITVEYRWPLWRSIDGFAFLDEGKVFERISDDFDWRNWHHSAGFGVRVWNPEHVTFSATLATGAEGPRFFFQAGQEF
ncbi:MAG: BamA/TamA family outer membrane protein, partial [candidate division Zixibacteria bacterium]